MFGGEKKRQKDKREKLLKAAFSLGWFWDEASTPYYEKIMVSFSFVMEK